MSRCKDATRHSPAAIALCALAMLVAAAPASALDGTITTFTGPGTQGVAGDGGPATAANLTDPSGVFGLAGGGTLIADSGNSAIRLVDVSDNISTVAGKYASPGNAGDNNSAVGAQLAFPAAAIANAGGGYLIADANNNRIRRVDNAGIIFAAAGDGVAGFKGDGLSPTDQSVELDNPHGMALLPDGSYLIADTGNHVVRLVTAGPNSQITTVAGVGAQSGYAGDGGPATAALLNQPKDVSPTADGGFLIADAGNHVIRKVSSINPASQPTITTVAGVGEQAGGKGDNGPATSAQLNTPEGIMATADSGFLIADTFNHRVRRVDASGTITTVFGTGNAGFGGDGGPASQATLDQPTQIAPTADGTALLIADTGNGRIRRVALPANSGPSAAPAASPPAGPGSLPPPPPTVAAPTVGTSYLLTPLSGTVLVRVSGRFVVLRSVANVPNRSEVDATHGVVQITVAADLLGDSQTAIAWAGRYIVDQRADGSLTDLRLSGPLSGCARARRGASTRPHAHIARTKRSPAPRVRTIRVQAHGRFRTDGRYGSAIVRGTRWETSDICRPHLAGTLVIVTQGLVGVRDFVRRRTIVVPAGHRYFARTRPAG